MGEEDWKKEIKAALSHPLCKDTAVDCKHYSYGRCMEGSSESECSHYIDACMKDMHDRWIEKNRDELYKKGGFQDKNIKQIYTDRMSITKKDWDM